MRWRLFADLAEVAGTDEVDLDAEAATVGEALDALLGAHPDLADRVLDEEGALVEHVNLLHEGEAVDPGAARSRTVEPDDELALFPPVSGG